MKKVVLTEISIEELEGIIHSGVKSALEKYSPLPAKKEDLISRKEVAEMFKVSLVTVDAWRDKRLLKPYKFGNKIIFKRSEIEQSLDSNND